MREPMLHMTDSERRHMQDRRMVHVLLCFFSLCSLLITLVGKPKPFGPGRQKAERGIMRKPMLHTLASRCSCVPKLVHCNTGCRASLGKAQHMCKEC
jgi:hypothetical protein